LTNKTSNTANRISIEIPDILTSLPHHIDVSTGYPQYVDNSTRKNNSVKEIPPRVFVLFLKKGMMP